MEFEWDPAKSEGNRHKHGITFLTARQVFSDPDRMYIDSTREGDGERRTIVIGKIADGRLFTVVFTMRSDVTRIISARRSRHAERRAYSQSEAAG